MRTINLFLKKIRHGLILFKANDESKIFIKFCHSLHWRLFAFLCILLIELSVQAQSESQAFDSLNLGLEYISNINRNVFHEYWNPKPGFSFQGETSFYYGDLQAGIQIMPFKSSKEYIPDFLSLFYYLQWGKGIKLPYSFLWSNNLRLGSYVMFMDDSVYLKDWENFTESELTLGLNSKISYQMSKDWLITFSGTYQVIYTHKRIRLIIISCGLNRKFGTPKWLKEFLR